MTWLIIFWRLIYYKKHKKNVKIRNITECNTFKPTKQLLSITFSFERDSLHNEHSIVPRLFSSLYKQAVLIYWKQIFRNGSQTSNVTLKAFYVIHIHLMFKIPVSNLNFSEILSMVITIKTLLKQHMLLLQALAFIKTS